MFSKIHTDLSHLSFPLRVVVTEQPVTASETLVRL